MFFFWGYLWNTTFNLIFWGNILNQKYKEIYDDSINKKEEFWKNISNDIFWYNKPTKILNSSNPPFYKWFEDGVTNTCYNALDFHIDKGRGDKLAIIYDSPITGTKKKITYNQLRDNVALFAGALKNQGVNKGCLLYTSPSPRD